MNTGYPKSPRGATAARTPLRWDPQTLLKLKNAETEGGITCTSLETTRNRRCRNPIAWKKKEAYLERLDHLACQNAWVAAESAELGDIAKASLCHRHVDKYAEELTYQWRTTIRLWAGKNQIPQVNDDPAATLATHERLVPVHEYNRVLKLVQELQQQLAREKQEREEEREDAEHWIEDLLVQLKEQDKADQTQKRNSTSVDKKEWIDAWKNYCKAWDTIKGIDCEPKPLSRNLRWPVKSGRIHDVTEANVQAFFREAQQLERLDQADWLSMIRTELHDWEVRNLVIHFEDDFFQVWSTEALVAVKKVQGALAGLEKGA